MSYTKVFIAALFIISAYPVQASEVSKLNPGEAMVVMPDGRMAVVKLTKSTTILHLKAGLKRLENCSMFMATADGNILQVDTARDVPRAICEELAQ